MLFLAAALILTCTLSLVLHDGARRASDSDDDLTSTADVSPVPAPAPAEAEPEPAEVEPEPAEAEPAKEPEPPEEYPPEDMRTAERALRAVMETYRAHGMVGLNVAIDECYARALTLRTLAAVEYCFVLDDGAAGLERAFAAGVHVEPDERNTRGAVDLRLEAAWRQLHFTRTELAMRKILWRRVVGATLDRVLAKDEAKVAGYTYDDGAAEARLARTPGDGVDPAEPVAVQRGAVTRLVAEGAVARAPAAVETFRSLGDARRAAYLLTREQPGTPDDVIAQIDRRLVAGTVTPAMRAGDAQAFLYVVNGTDTPVGALILDVADRPCREQAAAGHAWHVVRRRDRLPLEAQDELALLTDVPIVSAPGRGQCLTVVGAVPPATAARPGTSGNMSFSLYVDDRRPRHGRTAWLFADGEITDGTARALEAFVQQTGVEPGTRVILNSPGGMLKGGMELGDTIRRLGLQTDIGRRVGTGRHTRIAAAACESACGTAYLGGTFRHLHPGSTFGVHRFWTTDREQDTVEDGQIMTAELIKYVTRQGASPDLVARIAQTPASRMENLAVGELLAMHVVTGSVAAEGWSLASANGRIYVAGQRQDQHGTQKFMLLCKREQNLLLATAVTALDDGDIAASLATSATAGVTIDDRIVSLRGAAAPALTLRDGAVWAQWPLQRRDVDALLAAKTTIGFTLAQPAEQLTAGFQITLGDGRKMISDYARDCFRTAAR